jgi:DUF917 family protein
VSVICNGKENQEMTSKAEQPSPHSAAAPKGFSLTTEDLPDFVRGAAFMGTGGGGDPYVGRLVLINEMVNGGKLNIISLSDLDDDAFVMPVAMMGAPTVMTEKMPSVDAFEAALRAAEAHFGRTVDALIPLEVGGINSVMPLVLGARLGLPVVNADGMGRAFPEIQMVSFGVYGCNISPIFVTNEKGDLVIVKTSNNKDGEDLARSVVVRMGGAAHIVCYPMSGRDVKRTAIPDTLTLAHTIGRTIRLAREHSADPIQSLFDHLAVESTSLAAPRATRILFDGKIIDVRRETKGGFNIGRIMMEEIGLSGSRCEVEFQNENLIARRDGAVIAMVPDLITIVDRETSEPLTTEQLKYGQRVKVIGLGVPAIMRTPEAIATFGPKAFNLGETYIPLEQLTSC